MISEVIKKKEELKKVAKVLLTQFPDQRIFAFYGKMGAGKTTFIQAFCRQLGSTDNITSPSFALINEYKTPSSHSIFHFDFYRIKKMEEAYDLGYEDYFYSGEYCLIEWPEKIEPLLPDQYVRIDIMTAEDEERIIQATLI